MAEPVAVYIAEVIWFSENPVDGRKRIAVCAEKDVCSGCMQREEQRDRWIEASRQNGVAAEQAKQAWYREQDRAEHAEAAIERVRRFSELVINGSIRVQAIHQARDTLTVLNGDELKDPVIEAERDEAEQRIGRLTDQLVAEREKRRGAETVIAQARALHRDDHGLCAECTNAVGVPSPCDTARALDLPATTTGGA